MSQEQLKDIQSVVSAREKEITKGRRELIRVREQARKAGVSLPALRDRPARPTSGSGSVESKVQKIRDVFAWQTTVLNQQTNEIAQATKSIGEKPVREQGGKSARDPPMRETGGSVSIAMSCTKANPSGSPYGCLLKGIGIGSNTDKPSGKSQADERKPKSKAAKDAPKSKDAKPAAKKSSSPAELKEGATGVTYSKARKQWQARYRPKGQPLKHLGYFDTREAALAAVAKAKR